MCAFQRSILFCGPSAICIRDCFANCCVIVLRYTADDVRAMKDWERESGMVRRGRLIRTGGCISGVCFFEILKKR